MILIIAEKPKAAKKIVSALGPVRTKKGGKSYYYETEGGSIVVAPAVGHLYGLYPSREGWDYPIFDVEWRPSYENKGFEYSRSYLRNLEKLAKEADELIIATDYDVEGAVIGANIVRLAAGEDDLNNVKRMKFSALTPKELRKAFNNAHWHNKFEKGMARAGILRHFMDWYWGINLSRALSHAYRRSGKFKVLSTGRVQGPTLKIVADKERLIREFESKYTYILLAHVEGFDAEGPQSEELKNIFPIFLELNSPAVVKRVKKNRSKIDNPPPFNLSDLQSDASRYLNITPKDTLKIAQSLYEDGYISYPRTSSQKLPEDLELDPLLKKLSQKYPFAKEFIGKKPKEGKKTDPAHPAIYPTGQLPKLKGRAARVYDLIAKRFLAAFSEPATRESTRLYLDISGHEFLIKGIKTVKKGFLEFYPSDLEESETPDAKKGDELPVDHFDLERKQDKPPRRYTAAGLITEMEKLGIGTKATRANIIDTLYQRGYIEGDSIEVTDLGLSVVKALESAVPDILSVELTQRFEKKMEEVHEGERDTGDVLDEAKANLKEILETFKKFEGKIGEAITKDARPKGDFAGTCECGAKIYKVISKRKKRYARCTGCDKTWGLPQRGKLKFLDETCGKCDRRLVHIDRKDTKFDLCMEHGFEYKSG